MKKLLTLFSVFCLSTSVIFAQSKANDIPVNQLPSNVSDVLNKYVQILQLGTLDECADEFLQVAGGGLVNPDFPISLRSDLKRFSLKKDFENIKYYKTPVEITRVNVSLTNGNGLGATAIKGKIYKIWIKKKNGQAGMPAPVSILVPENHLQINTPKVCNIGSF